MTAADLGVRHALERLGHDGSPAAVEQVSQHWRPYRAYAEQHLWALLGATAQAGKVRVSGSASDRIAA